ncbi:MAG: acetate/propionate family kinase [Bacteroidota bacterium]
MLVLVLNCGSSSVKAELIDVARHETNISMKLSRIGEAEASLKFSDEKDSISCPGEGHDQALRFAIPLFKQKLPSTIAGIGHRVVHGGEQFSDPTRITTEVIEQIEAVSSLAPLHNPVNLLGIRLAQEFWPDIPHVAVFDTAFHHTLPRRAREYALPKAWRTQYGLRRYGFHGTSHSYVAHRAAAQLGFGIRELRLISCHLGNGASICAVEYGRSVETSMGLTPLEGLVMGTRSGDVDPGILLHIQQQEKLSADDLDHFLNKESGLKGLSGDNDMRDIEDRAADGDEDARLAIQVFSHRLRKYIGAYAAVMGGVDAIIFTGGIGENSAVIRERVAQRLEFLGAILDEDANRDADLDDPKSIADISTSNSRCKLLVIPTDEQFEIARQSSLIIQEAQKVSSQSYSIPIAISARHVHLTQEVVEQLFGPGYTLTEYKALSQPGQFAANERVTLLGPKNQLERVRILGPTRSKCQVEIARTDEFFLGIDAPIRASGKVQNTPGIKLVGPYGSVSLKEGVICAWRHIHMTPEDAQLFGVSDKDIVEVRVSDGDRSLTFGDVLVRVSPRYKLEMHIDTDEGNAAELGRHAVGELIPIGESAQILRKQHPHIR